MSGAIYRQTRDHQCGRKKRFATREEAEAHKHPNDARMGAYECLWCGGWHLGHGSKRARNRAKAYMRKTVGQSEEARR